MLDKIQKILGFPNRLSTIWFIVTTLPYLFILRSCIANLGHNSIFSDIIILVFIFNFVLLLIYAYRIGKKK